MRRVAVTIGLPCAALGVVTTESGDGYDLPSGAGDFQRRAREAREAVQHVGIDHVGVDPALRGDAARGLAARNDARGAMADDPREYLRQMIEEDDKRRQMMRPIQSARELAEQGHELARGALGYHQPPVSYSIPAVTVPAKAPDAWINKDLIGATVSVPILNEDGSAGWATGKVTALLWRLLVDDVVVGMVAIEMDDGTIRYERVGDLRRD
jgi:hypothetical protein